MPECIYASRSSSAMLRGGQPRRKTAPWSARRCGYAVSWLCVGWVQTAIMNGCWPLYGLLQQCRSGGGDDVCRSSPSTHWLPLEAESTFIPAIAVVGKAPCWGLPCAAPAMCAAQVRQTNWLPLAAARAYIPAVAVVEEAPWWGPRWSRASGCRGSLLR